MQLRLGANESNFGTSPLAKEAMAKAIEKIGWYGDPESYELREHLATTHGIRREDISVGAGADDLLGLCAKTFLEAGDCAVNSLGGYPTFSYVVQGVGGTLEYVLYNNDRPDLKGLAEAAHRKGAKLVYLANPDNPSGSWHSASAVMDLVGTLPPHCILVLDEAYSDFAPLDSLPPIDPTDERIVRIRTFSKAHGMAGARVGYAIATAETIAAFDKVRLHFAVNAVAQAGALASLRDPGFVIDVVREVEKGRTEYVEMAGAHGLSCLPSSTNFVSIDMGSADSARMTLQLLQQQGVFIRMPGAAPLNRCIRVTVGTADERRRFAEHLRSILAELPIRA